MRIARLVRWMVVVGVLAGGAFVLVRLSTGAETTDPARSLVQDETLVEVGDLNVTVSATGIIMPARQVNLAFEMSAPVKEILVREGQPVRAGDVLARLDAPDLDTSLESARLAFDLQQVAYDALLSPARDVDIAAAEAALNAARAQVSAAFASGPTEGQIEIARLQGELARNRLWQQQLQRDDRLNPPEPPPGVPISAIPVLSDEQRAQIEAGLRQADYEILIADTNQQGVVSQGPDAGSLASANAQVVSAQAQLDRLLDGPSDIELQMAELELERARLALALAQTNRARGTLTAPFDGIVARVNLTVGELPPSGAGGAVELIDTSSYYIDLAVDETDVVSVSDGQPVTLSFDALPETRIAGTVTRVAFTPTRIGQVVTYTTRVTLDPTLDPVRAGMNTTATIVVSQVEDTLLLRNRFIRIDRSTQEAFATIQRPDGRFEEVRVELGARNETHSQILSGLTAGQRVVLLPRQSLIPGFGGS